MDDLDVWMFCPVNAVIGYYESIGYKSLLTSEKDYVVLESTANIIHIRTKIIHEPGKKPYDSIINICYEHKTDTQRNAERIEAST